MSNVALKWARMVQPPDICSAAVLLFLADSHNEKTDRCFPSKTTIASYLHCDIRTVERALKTLRKENLIVWVTQKTKSGKCNFYSFVGLNSSRGVTSSNGVTPRNGVTSFDAEGYPHEMGVRVPSPDAGITSNITRKITENCCGAYNSPESDIRNAQTLPSAEPMATQHTSSSENRLAGCPPCPVQQLVDLYHKTFPEGLRVVDITPKRRQAIKARWRQCYADGDFKTKDEGLKAFEYFFVNKIRTSDFLMGRVWEKDKGPFQITLDCIFNRDSFAKIVENFYVNRQNNQG